MENINILLNADNLNINTYIIKIFFISICTYFTFVKITNEKNFSKKKISIIYIITIVISIISGIIKYKTDSLTGIICLTFFLSVLYSFVNKKIIGYSIVVTIISLSINYALFFITIIINFMQNIVVFIQNDYINLVTIIIVHSILLYLLLRTKKLKNGLIFLNKKLESEYYDILILNISIIVLFSSIIFTNSDIVLTSRIFFGFIIVSIIMFITIQKSLQLYYKQKLLVQELNETKKELDKKKQEIEQLERENLNFSKTSHSIAHRQKALEYKLNQLILKTEIASEIDIKDKINEIAKELQTPTEVELSKTNISEIDNMLKYMQSECVKNKIDFQLQLSGNIHHMINKYVSKENLEILVADHIKNSIIAINHSNNINKSILIRLGIIDGIYSLYIYDSGVEFEIDTLLKLGKIPSTTHSDDGGTGMGFMNTFDTLKKYKASIVIKEYGKPCKDNYTKLIIIKFDDKNEYKICSYRQKEIKNKDNNNNLIVEELSL